MDNVLAFNKKIIAFFIAVIFLCGCSASTDTSYREEVDAKKNRDKVVLPEYLLVTDKGVQYPWFSRYEAREKYIDKHMPFIDDATKRRYLKRVPDISFDAINGDVGVLVDDYSHEDGTYVLDILGHLISIDKDGVESASLSEYKAFERKVNRKKFPLSGLSLEKQLRSKH